MVDSAAEPQFSAPAPPVSAPAPPDPPALPPEAFPPAPPPKRWPRIVGCIAALLYSVAAAAVSVWIAALAPIEGPPVRQFIPSNAAFVVEIRDGEALHRWVTELDAAREAFADEDVNELHPELEQVKGVFKTLREQTPEIVHRWLPTKAEDLYPFAGSDSALVLMPRETVSDGNRTRRRQPRVVLARVRGTWGHLARIAVAASGERNHVYNLPGGIVAFVEHRDAPTLQERSPNPFAIDAASGEPALLAIRAYPERLIEREQKVEPTDYQKDVAEELAHWWVPESIIGALLEPLDPSGIVNAKAPPKEIRVAFHRTASGLRGQGVIVGALPPLPAEPLASTIDEIPKSRTYAEALLPVNAQALFTWWVTRDMRIAPTAPPRPPRAPGAPPPISNVPLSRGQLRWARRFNKLEEAAGVDLPHDLWPSFGNVLHLAVHDAPEESGITGFGVVSAWTPFDGSKPLPRLTLGELARVNWDYLFDADESVPPNVKPDYVVRYFGNGFEKYIIKTGQTHAPSWIVSTTDLSITSDAGPFAFLNAKQDLEEQRTKTAPARRATSFFVRADGKGLAPTVAMLAESNYESAEKQMGPRDFLEKYPDFKTRIRVFRKAALWAGKVNLDVAPNAANTGGILTFSWEPGTLKGAEETESDVVAPPPQ